MVNIIRDNNNRIILSGLNEKNLYGILFSVSEGEYKKLWEHGLIVPDTNVIHNLYRYSKKTSNELLEVFQIYSERLWIPYQIGLEYQRNRLDIIKEPIKQCDDLITFIEDTEKNFTNGLNRYTRHPFIDPKKPIKEISEILQNIKNSIKEKKKSYPDFSKDDPIRDKLTTFFKGKVGNKPLAWVGHRRIEKTG